MIRQKNILIICIAALILNLVPLADGLTRDAEYDLKAAFFTKLLSFITFPEKTGPDATRTPTVAVLGKDPFGQKLEESLGQIYVEYKKKEVARFSSLEDFLVSNQAFDVVFVSISDRNQFREALTLLSTQGSLTIGDRMGFCRQGGMIGLKKSNNRIQFEINRLAAEQAGLQISSKLLALATIIDSDSPGGKK